MSIIIEMPRQTIKINHAEWDELFERLKAQTDERIAAQMPEYEIDPRDEEGSDVNPAVERYKSCH